MLLGVSQLAQTQHKFVCLLTWPAFVRFYILFCFVCHEREVYLHVYVTTQPLLRLLAPCNLCWMQREWKRVFHVAVERKWREIDFGLNLVPAPNKLAAVTFRSSRLIGLSTRDKSTNTLCSFFRLFLYDSERGSLSLVPIYYTQVLLQLQSHIATVATKTL
jgi:hypothetical protein